MHRVEVDLASGVRREITQKAYRDEGGAVVVLDATEKAPKGFKEFQPEAELQDNE